MVTRRKTSSARAPGGLRWAPGIALATLLALTTLPGHPLLGQEADGRAEGQDALGWGSQRANTLVTRMIEAREFAYADSALRRLRAEVQGHVYFLGEFQGQRQVIRADQVALDVRWEAPNQSRQVLIGRRNETRLPTNIRYHTDHLSLILDNFGDRIRLGEGDEVANVLHPAASGAPNFYEYRLSDSLEIRIRDRTARVFELEVRPRRPDEAGVVGSVFVDRDSGAIARMRLTFTRAAYRDPDLVRIVFDFRSGLWEGRFWLPVEQDLEITRALSWLDFPLETVIRTRLEVRDYYLNEEPPYRLGPGQYVATMPAEALEAFDDWSRPLYGGPIEARERSDEELSRAISSAQALLGQQILTGGNRLRVSLPNASSGLRVRRAEGLLVGAGGAFRINDRTRFRMWGGFPTGSGRPQATGGVRWTDGIWDVEVEGWLRANRDVGSSAASGAIQTLGLLFGGEDYEDPYFEDGGRFAVGHRAGAVRTDFGISFRRQRLAELVLQNVPIGGGLTRPVRPIDEGQAVVLDVGVELDLGEAVGARWSASVRGEGATDAIGTFGYTRGTLAVAAQRDLVDSPWAWSSEVMVGLVSGDAPAQQLFLMGGRGTLPGYAFRPWGGDQMGLWRTEVSRRVWGPWIRARLSGGLGWTRAGSIETTERFGATDSDGIRSSAGVGVGLFYDLVRVDLFRGLSSDSQIPGDWTLIFSLDPRMWGIL